MARSGRRNPKLIKEQITQPAEKQQPPKPAEKQQLQSTQIIRQNSEEKQPQKPQITRKSADGNQRPTKEQPKKAQVIRQKSDGSQIVEDQNVQNSPSISPSVAKELKVRSLVQETNSEIPVRTVVTIEVGDMKPQESSAIIQSVLGQYNASKHPHYIIPTRNGKMNTDVGFEIEFLNVIRDLCEYDDQIGKIVFKEDAKNVNIKRFSI